jgi:hypothetical protein
VVLTVELSSLSEEVVSRRDERVLALTVSRFRLESCSMRLAVLVESSEVSLDDEPAWAFEMIVERSSGSAFMIDALAPESRMLYMESDSELSLESPRRLTMSSTALSAEEVEELEAVEVVDDDKRFVSRDVTELDTELMLDMGVLLRCH